MCARRFLIFVFVLILIAVAGAFAVFQYGGEVLLKQATPKGHFVAAKAGGEPDYSKLDNWLSRPGVSNDPSHWMPDDAGYFMAILPRTATFYVHPTTYLKTDHWNGPLNPDKETAARTRLFAQTQASAFRDDTEVWAPKYRQAAYGAFLLKSEDAQRALDLAYQDVRAAFDVFLASQPKNRPIVLAGHSQGALHLIRLLQERHDQLKGRLVAAYVPGWPIDTKADLPSLGFPACTSKGQAGCILSWMSFGEPPNTGLMLESWRKTKGPTGLPRKAKDILCVNPLTGTLSGIGSPGNMGSLIPTDDFRSARLVPGAVNARCKDGLLILDANVPKIGPYVLPGNNYHVYDYALFWGAIRDDYVTRAAMNWPAF